MTQKFWSMCRVQLGGQTRTQVFSDHLLGALSPVPADNGIPGSLPPPRWAYLARMAGSCYR